MKFVISVFIIICFVQINSTFGWMSRGNGSHPDYPGRCYLEENQIYPNGESKLDNCTYLYCDGESGWYTVGGCGISSLSLEGYNCTQGDFVDVSLPYPKCCKRYFNCVDDKGNALVKEA